MNLQEIQDELTKIGYMPGWTLFAWQHDYEGVWLTIRTTQPDYRAGKDSVDLGIDSPLPPMRDVQQLLDWVEWRLATIWRHESDEAITYEGEHVFDPHVPGRNDPPDQRAARSGCPFDSVVGERYIHNLSKLSPSPRTVFALESACTCPDKKHKVER